MYRFPFRFIASFVLPILFSACANIVPPSGGKIDKKPPKLLSIKPNDSLLNTRVTKIDMRFDEFVTLNDATKEVKVSPILPQNPILSVSGKTVTLKIADSLLQANTTYTISMGNAIADLHEGNKYQSKIFIFSTGGWFDSLSIKGNIIDALSGKRDSTGNVKVLLYDAQDSFDVVTGKKPIYICMSQSDGSFIFQGLPDKAYRIFALKEQNESLKFDSDDELIAFADKTYKPSEDTSTIALSIFKEIPDSSKSKVDTIQSQTTSMSRRSTKNTSTVGTQKTLDNKTFNYVVLADTLSPNKRSQDITKPLVIIFSRPIDTFNLQKINLSIDSSDIELEHGFKITLDSTRKQMTIAQNWINNTKYTLRLLKGFAKDTAANEATPSKHIFKSKSEEDYGKLEIKIPSKYIRKNYLLKVALDAEIIFLESILQEKINLKYLQTGNYNLAIIEDKDGDGAWTTGELKNKRQAELVIPYPNNLNIKPGWEHVIDFEHKKEIKN